MFNNVIGKLDNFFSDAGQGNPPGNTGGGNVQQRPNSGAGIGEQRPEDIPREELLQLCMKMNTRMKTMESKYKEISRKKTTLVNERMALIQHLETILQSPLLLTTAASAGDPLSPQAAGGVAPGEQDLDLQYIQRKVDQYQEVSSAKKKNHEDRIRQFERELMELQNKNALLTAMMNTPTQPSVVKPVARDLVSENLIDLSDPGDVSKPTQSNNVEGDASPVKNTAALIDLNNSLQQQLIAMQMDNKDHHSKLQRYEVEQERLKGVETFLKEQLKALENVVLQKNQELEHSTKEREKEKVQWEEKVVYVTMQLQQVKQQRDEMINVLKPKLEEEIQRYKQESELYASKWKSLQNQKDEEKEILLSSNKEMIIALQQRLLQIEPESAHFKERCHELERHLQALKVMKMEQDNVVTALTKDLQNARDQSQQLSTLPQELLDWKEKYEQMSLKYTQVQEKCTKLQEENEEKQGTITRLRSEATVTERNYAMKTAMLATCEAQLETFQQEIHEKDLKMKEMLDMTSTSQQQITSLEQKMQQLVQEYQEKEQKLLETKQQEDQAKEQELSKWKEDSQQMIENLKKDFAKKSAMARQLLSEREDEVRSLSQKVKELQDEIASGAPTDRKILELAKEQSKRDAMNVMHRDNRELAFQQLQRTLAVKDFELAQCLQRVNDLNNEVADLRKIKQREGINMDYLKNVVYQYMTLSAQTSERQALVPVLAMLLQFNAKEMMEVQKAMKDPNYGVKPVKEVKRVDFSNLFSFGSSTSNPSSPIRTSPGSALSDASSSNGQSRSLVIDATANYSNNMVKPPLAPAMRSPDGATNGNGLRKSELSESDQELHQKLKKFGGDILDMNVSNDDVETHSLQSLTSPRQLSDDGFFSKAL